MLLKLGSIHVEPGTPGQPYSYVCDPVPPSDSGPGGGGGGGPIDPGDSGDGPCTGSCIYVNVYDPTIGAIVSLPLGCCP